MYTHKASFKCVYTHQTYVSSVYVPGYSCINMSCHEFFNERLKRNSIEIYQGGFFTVYFIYVPSIILFVLVPLFPPTLSIKPQSEFT